MKTSPKDFFLHLFSTIILYTVVGSLIDLSFTIVNRLYPDNLYNYFYPGSLIWPISMLIVLTPLLYTFEKLIVRDIARMPEKKDIWIRRWRIFLTLFLNVATIAGDLIALINTYLNGEVTARLIWKVLIIFVISAVVFAYYYLSLQDSTPKVATWRRSLGWAGMVLVLAGIVSGFLIVGSPGKQRALRFDEQRVNDLQNIQSQIVSYWQRTGHLPDSLETLNDPLSYFSVPHDPDTRASYEYISLNRDPNAFAVCATFALASADVNGKAGTYLSRPLGDGETWSHPAGHQCFSRTIDPALYPPLKK